MDYIVMEHIFLLVLVTLFSVLQNAFFCQKVEKECKTQNVKASALERVCCANCGSRHKLICDGRGKEELHCFSHYLLIQWRRCQILENGSRNCMDSYPTFLAVMWCAGLCLNQAPAAFAGVIYLVARQKYFVGYMGQTIQSTPGYQFGKRILSFLFLMCIVGIVNFLLVRHAGSEYKEYVETITSAASALLLIP